MFVSSCPHCADPVTVPTRARPTSRVRCPLCSAEFTVADIKLPPMLEFLDEEEAWEAASSATYASRAVGDDDGGVATLVADDEPRAERPTYEFDGPTSTTTAEPGRKLRTSPRPKKAAKSPIFEAIKIALGGLAALPISQLILWWAAGNDPFEMGPTVARYAPWIVPAQFHQSEEEKAQQNKAAAPAAGNNKKKSDSRIEGLPKLENTDIPSFQFPDTNDQKSGDAKSGDEPMPDGGELNLPDFDLGPLPNPLEGDAGSEKKDNSDPFALPE